MEIGIHPNFLKILAFHEKLKHDHKPIPKADTEKVCNRVEALDKQIVASTLLRDLRESNFDLLFLKKIIYGSTTTSNEPNREPRKRTACPVTKMSQEVPSV